MTAFIAGLVFQAFGLVIGTVFAYMGYRLFSKGTFETSDVEAVWSDRRLLLKRAAPGTVFALFGVAVIAIATYKPLSITEAKSAGINGDVLKVLQKVVSDRYVEVEDSFFLQGWIKQEAPNFQFVKYVYETKTTDIPMPPKAVIEKLADREALSVEERVAVLEWYIGTHVSQEMPVDIRGIIGAALFFKDGLEEPEKLKLKAWVKQAKPGQVPGTFSRVTGPHAVPELPLAAPDASRNRSRHPLKDHLPPRFLRHQFPGRMLQRLRLPYPPSQRPPFQNPLHLRSSSQTARKQGD